MLSTDIFIAVFATLGGVLLLAVLLLFLIAGFNGNRVGLGLHCLMRALRDAAFASKVEPMLNPPPSEAERPARPSGESVRLLSILQRDARLVDFLMEDIHGAINPQTIAAVEKINAAAAQALAATQTIHHQSQAALKKHLVLAPVLPDEEGAEVQVPAGFDPSAVRLTGNVTGEPPFRGTLQHPGWRVTEINLPPLPEGQDDLVLMPAEVELS